MRRRCSHSGEKYNETFKGEIRHLKCWFSQPCLQTLLGFWWEERQRDKHALFRQYQENLYGYSMTECFVSVMFCMSLKNTLLRGILQVRKPGLAVQALFWVLEWRKQKLLLLPPCLHFCPYFSRCIFHWCLFLTSNETTACQKLMFWAFVPGCLNLLPDQTILTVPYSLAGSDAFFIFFSWKLPFRLRV